MPLASLPRAALAVDARLTPRRVRHYAFLFLAVTLVLYAFAVAAGDPPFDAFGQPLAVDFAARAIGGRIVLAGDARRLYDLEYQFEVERNLLGGAAAHGDTRSLFVSPPFVAYLYAPFAALPYVAGAALWTALSVALLLASLRLLWPLVANLHRHGFGVVLLVAFSTQPVNELLGDGQDSALSLLLLAAGLRLLLAGRDFAAGAVLGLGVFKPQLFLLMPILLLLQRRWRALAGWGAVAVCLAALSVALVGPEGVWAYAGLVTSEAYQRAVADAHGWKMQSLVDFARVLLPAPAAPLAGPATAAAGAAVLALFASAALRPARNGRDLTRLYTLAVLATAALSPHFPLYDCTILLLPALVLLNEAPSQPVVRLSLAAAYALTWTAAARHFALGRAPWPLAILGGPLTAVPVLALFAFALRLPPRRAGAEPAPSPPAGAAGSAPRAGTPAAIR